MGRLQSVDSRKRVVTVRLNEEEYAMLLDVQSENGAIFSEIIRKAIRFYCNFIKRNRQ